MNSMTMQTPQAHSAKLLKLLHLVSPALPVGAYAYSNGQEFAVDSGWIKTNDEIANWVSGILQNALAVLDLPLLLRTYRAWRESDIQRLKYWNAFIRANRETKELLLEDEQLGLALQRLLVSLEMEQANLDLEMPVSFVTMFALAGVSWNIPEEELLQGFAWSWLENQIAAATKTVPLGQTQAQKLLVKIMEDIPAVCDRASQIKDEDLGSGLPALAIASCLHERQYSRLFRS